MAAAVPTMESLPSDEVRATETIPSGGEIPYVGDAGERVTGGEGKKVASDKEHDEADVMVLDDTEMSAGESSGLELGSRFSSGSGSSSSCVSQSSRKRAAENSSEQEVNDTARQRFPGAISRGAGGCRVYVPSGTTTEGGKPCAVTAVDEKTVPASGTMAGATAGASMSAPVKPLVGVTATAPTNPSTDSTMTAAMDVLESTCP